MATANAATSFLEYKVLDFIFKNNSSSFATPGDNIYVGLATAVSNFNDTTGETGNAVITEVNTSTQDSNYQRKQVNAAGWTPQAISADTQNITNAGNIEFDASGGQANYTVTHAFIATHQTDAPVTFGSNGNVLFVGTLNTAKTIQSGDIFRINATNLTIELK
ncbi:MAG: hypothetical protein CMG35_07970 [Candidatus Marinimicrobia bacterium]|nr:hypothetical protein [Candidatus Neomarinimicrobiota bacterium]